MVVTLVSVLSIVAGVGLIVFASVLFLANTFLLSHPILGNILLHENPPLAYLFDVLTGVYSTFQGYGLWKLRAWAWWLCGVAVFARVAIVVVENLNPISVAVELFWLAFFFYLIMQRHLFNVKLPIVN